MVVGAGAVSAAIYMVFSPVKSITPLAFMLGAALPFIYVWFVRGRRMKKFGAQLPEALDLITQALRAGQSLPAGIQLILRGAHRFANPHRRRAAVE